MGTKTSEPIAQFPTPKHKARQHDVTHHANFCISSFIRQFCPSFTKQSQISRSVLSYQTDLDVWDFFCVCVGGWGGGHPEVKFHKFVLDI